VRAHRSPPFVPALLLIGVTGLTAGCGGRDKSPHVGEPSHAADAIIGKARTPEERRALERARDEIDQEMRERIRALDGEIEALRRENEELARKLRDH
jgi:hypothetical protein